MSLGNYFLKITVDMTRTRPKKKLTGQSGEASALEMFECEDASCSSTDTDIFKAMDKLSENITKVIDAKINTVLAAIRDQTTQIQALGTRVGEAEDRIAGIETTTESLQAKVTSLEKQVSGMLDHIDDLDNRGRRCNIRVVGLTEGTEGADPVRYMEKWIPDYLKLTSKGGRVKLDRAHRSLAPKPGSNQRPRPIILKLHTFSDKQQVMNTARRLGVDPDQPARTGPRISFFNDYSAAVVRKRKAFHSVKERLKKMGIVYALIYPATLKWTVNGTEKRFDTPEAAAAFVDSLG
jgi:hypothetical protein